MRRPTHTNAGDPICARLRVYVRKLVGSVLPRPGGVRETQKCQVQRRLVASKFRVTNGYPLAQTWCVACVELILLPNKSARAEPEACMWRSWHHDLLSTGDRCMPACTGPWCRTSGFIAHVAQDMLLEPLSFFSQSFGLSLHVLSPPI